MSSAPKNSSPASADTPAQNSVGNALRGVPPSGGNAPLGTAQPLPFSRHLTYFVLFFLGFALDNWTKNVVFRWRGLPRFDNAWWLIPGRFGIETSINPGALFGMGAGWWWLFASLSVVALCGIMTWLFAFRAAHDRWITVALGLVSGGILGNLYDRLGLWDNKGVPPELQHGVRDWILFVWPEIKLQIFNPWPNFNIADTLLVTGAIMLVIHAFIWQDNREEAKTAA